jgi:hypothetical protein
MGMGKAPASDFDFLGPCMGFIQHDPECIQITWGHSGVENTA